MKISAMVLVSKNEPYLEYCLKSIEYIVDEIIMVKRECILELPSGSYNPKKINLVIQDIGDKVDFAAWRNQALEACSGEYVLWLDSDEVFANLDGTPVTRKVLEGLCNAMKEEDYPSTSFFTRHFIYNYFTIDGRNNATHVSRDRLFKRASVVGWKGKVHERMIFKDKYNTRNMMGPCIWHFSHCKGMEDLVNRYKERHIKDNPFTGKMDKEKFDEYLKNHPILRGTIPLAKYEGPLPQVMNLW